MHAASQSGKNLEEVEMAGKKKTSRAKAPVKRGPSARLGLAIALAAGLAVLLAGALWPVEPRAAEYDYRVLAKLPHDADAFTQGLVYQDGNFFESTGLRGESTLRKVNAESGDVLLRRRLEETYFGEGLCLFDNKLYQLTYQEGKAFVYNSETFIPIESFDYGGEGWGLTHDGSQLIMSNGTDVLSFRDPENFAEKRSLRVRFRGKPLTNLNELEYIKGEIWANVWQTKRIVRISPETGHVLGSVFMKKFPPRSDRTGDEDYLNGIAYDPEGDRLFVTGKRYAYIYQIELFEKE